MSGIVAPLLQVAGLCGLAAATGVDLKSRIIPNELVVWVIIVGLGSRVAVDGPACWLSLVVAVGVFLPLGLLAQREIIGGGDAKMIAATTLLVEPANVPSLVLATALAGGVLAVFYLAAFQAVRPRPGASGPDGVVMDRPTPLGPIGSAVARILGKEPMPYSLAILTGVAFALFREAF